MAASLVELAETMVGWDFLDSRSFPFDEPDSSERLTIMRQFLQLYLSAATSQERTQARKLLHTRAKRGFWYLLEYCLPIENQSGTWADRRAAAEAYQEQHYLDWLRFCLVKLGIGYGMIDYRDDILASNDYASSALSRGVNYYAIAQEIADLNTDYVELPEPLEPTLQLAAEIAALTQGIEAGYTDASSVAELYLKRALAYLQINQFKQARADLKSAHDIDQDNGEVIFQLGAVYGRLGAFDNAFRLYVNFLVNHPDHLRADEMRDRLNQWRPLHSSM